MQGVHSICSSDMYRLHLIGQFLELYPFYCYSSQSFSWKRREQEKPREYKDAVDEYKEVLRRHFEYFETMK